MSFSLCPLKRWSLGNIIKSEVFNIKTAQGEEITWIPFFDCVAIWNHGCALCGGRRLLAVESLWALIMYKQNHISSTQSQRVPGEALGSLEQNQWNVASYFKAKLPMSYVKDLSLHLLFSTGNPKGAMITHENVISNSAAFLRCVEVSGQLKERSSLKCESVKRF